MLRLLFLGWLLCSWGAIGWCTWRAFRRVASRIRFGMDDRKYVREELVRLQDENRSLRTKLRRRSRRKGKR